MSAEHPDCPIERCLARFFTERYSRDTSPEPFTLTRAAETGDRCRWEHRLQTRRLDALRVLSNPS